MFTFDEERLHRWLLSTRAEMASAPRTDLDQCPATPCSVIRRLKLLGRNSEEILLLGDDDLLALALAATDARSRIVVVDGDAALLRVIEQQCQTAPVETVCCDLRDGLPQKLHNCFDVVFTDPPYTLEGQLLFAQRGMLALRDRADVSLFVCVSPAYLSPIQLATVRSFLARGGFEFSAEYHSFNRYKATPDVSRDLAAFGARDIAWLYSDLYHYVRCRPAPVPGLPPRTVERIYAYDEALSP